MSAHTLFDDIHALPLPVSAIHPAGSDRLPSDPADGDLALLANAPFYHASAFAHSAGLAALMEHHRCSRNSKAERLRFAIGLASACRIFLALERAAADVQGLPQSRSGAGLAHLMTQVELLLSLSDILPAPMPTPRAFRRALRTYEHAGREAAALLELILETR